MVFTPSAWIGYKERFSHPEFRVNKQVYNFLLYSLRLGTNSIGVLAMAYFQSTEVLYFTTGLTQTQLVRLTPESVKSVVAYSDPQSRIRYYHRLLRKDPSERYLFYRNRENSISVFEELGAEKTPSLLAEVNGMQGDIITDFIGYNNYHIACISSTGFLIPVSFRNGILLRLPTPKLDLDRNESLVTCQVCQKEDYLFASSMVHYQDAPRQGRVFIFKIDKEDGVMTFFSCVNFKNMEFARFPNSFIKEMCLDSYLDNQPVLTAFPHAGGSELMVFVMKRDGKLTHLKTIKDYHSRSIICSEVYSGRIWTLDGNGVLFNHSLRH